MPDLLAYALKGTTANKTAYRNTVSWVWKLFYQRSQGTVRTLLHRPRNAIAYCNEVRKQLGAPNLRDYQILETLSRLHGKAAAGRPRKPVKPRAY